MHNDKKYYIYGHHPVWHAIGNKERKNKECLLTTKAFSIISKNPDFSKIEYKLVDKHFLNNLLAHDMHQGIVLNTEPLKEKKEINIEEDIVLALDRISDVHNIGAIIRTAVAFGVKTIITTKDHGISETPGILKAASGMFEYIDLIKVTNLGREISILKKRDYWIIGMDGNAKDDLKEIVNPEKKVIVMGSEGSGIRKNIKEKCDFITRIELKGITSHINVSNACAIALFHFT